MPSQGTVPFLVAMMLATGVANTLLTKYQVSVKLHHFHCIIQVCHDLGRLMNDVQRIDCTYCATRVTETYYAG
jgi:hypothetical protein